MKTIDLDVSRQRDYLALATALVKGGRVSLQWPPLRPIANALAAMGPDLHHGAYPTLQVDLNTGLPTWREWQRVSTDHEMAAETLAGLGDPAELERRGHGAAEGSVHHRRWNRYRYLKALSTAPAPPSDRLDVQLRRIEGEATSVALQMDKFDAGGLFVRMSVELREISGTEHIIREGEEVMLSEQLRSMLYRASGLTAETTHLLLSAQGDLHVERVVRAVVGPLSLPDLNDSGAQLDSGHLALSLDMTAFDLSADRHNDPERVDEQLDDDRRGARRRLGYRVFTDRRFVATADAATAVKTRCAEAGTRNTVRTIRLRKTL
ncbi:MAG: hypothetical protein ACE366_11125 [Bradymonadia bacterium]